MMQFVETVIAFCLFVIVGVSAYWLVEPAKNTTKVLETYQTDEFGKLKTEFKAGERLFYFRRLTILHDVPRTANAVLICDDTRVVYTRLAPVAGGTGNPLEGKEFTQVYIALTLPDFLPPCNYSFRMDIDYQLNPFRREKFEVPRVLFKVVK